MKSMFDEQATWEFVAARLREVERERLPGPADAPAPEVEDWVVAAGDWVVDLDCMTAEPLMPHGSMRVGERRWLLPDGKVVRPVPPPGCRVDPDLTLL